MYELMWFAWLIGWLYTVGVAVSERDEMDEGPSLLAIALVSFLGWPVLLGMTR